MDGIFILALDGMLSIFIGLARELIYQKRRILNHKNIKKEMMMADIKEKEELVIGDKKIIIDGNLLHTILLVFILMITFGSFCMQLVFNYMESRDRQNMMDLQAIGMVAGSTASMESLFQMKDEVKAILVKKKKEMNQQ